MADKDSDAEAASRKRRMGPAERDGGYASQRFDADFRDREIPEMASARFGIVSGIVRQCGTPLARRVASFEPDLGRNTITCSIDRSGVGYAPPRDNCDIVA